jgi:predicted ferric reductase
MFASGNSTKRKFKLMGKLLFKPYVLGMFHLYIKISKNVSFRPSITFFLLTLLNIMQTVGLKIYFKIRRLNEI